MTANVHDGRRPGQQRPAGASAWPAWLRELPRLATVVHWWRAHPMLTDTVLAFAVLGLTHGRTVNGFPWAVQLSVLLSVGVCLPLIWRRRYPRAVYGVQVAVAIVQYATGVIVVSNAALLVGLYTVAATCRRRWSLSAIAVLELGIAAVALTYVLPQNTLTVFVFLSGMAVAAFVLGVNIQTRRAYLASVEDRALRAEHERDQQSQIAAAAERARIAREMHDVIAHNLSVMIALADGAAFAARTSSAQAESAARQVSATGRQALAEMHRLLGVLRDASPGPSRAPQPGIDQLDDLVAQVRSAGLTVTLTLSGAPFPLPTTAELAVYRVAQEALTNVLKHARTPGLAAVRLRYDRPVVELEVVDDGQPVPAGQGKTEGHGLAGMRERAALFGGDVQAGPMRGGGWRVALRLDTGTVLDQ